MGPSSVLLHREEVAKKHHRVAAGTKVHRCLGEVGRLQHDGKFSVLDLEMLYPLSHLLSPWWEGHVSNGSASAHVPGLVSTSTCSHDPDPEYISVSGSVLSLPPGIWGPE